MTLFLDYISSLEYWRTHSLPKGNPQPAALSQRVSHQPKQDTARQNCDSAIMRLYKEAASNTEHVDLKIELAILKEEVPNLTFPCHLLLPEASARKSSKDVICRVTSPNKLPSRSFAAVSNNIFVCSPELCFARAGIAYNKMQLAQLGFELCGTYRLGHFTNGTGPNQLKTAASKLTSVKRRSITLLNCIQEKVARPQKTSQGGSSIRPLLPWNRYWPSPSRCRQAKAVMAYRSRY